MTIYIMPCSQTTLRSAELSLTLADNSGEGSGSLEVEDDAHEVSVESGAGTDFSVDNDQLWEMTSGTNEEHILLKLLVYSTFIGKLDKTDSRLC